MTDHTTFINKIRELGHSPEEIEQILGKATSKMPEAFAVIFKDWNQCFTNDDETRQEVIDFVRENGIHTQWKEQLKAEIEAGKYRKLMGWSPFAYFVREFMKDKVNDVGEVSSMVDDFLNGLGA